MFYFNKEKKVKKKIEEATFLCDKGDCTQALQVIEEGLLLNENSYSLLILKGGVLNALSQYEDAYKCLEKAISIEPHNWIGYHNQATSLRYLNRFDEAEKLYLKIINEEKENVALDTMSQYSYLLNLMEKYEESYIIVDILVEAEPDNFSYIARKGECLMKLNNENEAISCFNKAIELDPNSYELDLVYFNKGVCLKKIKSYSEAISCFNKAIELNPNSYQLDWIYFNKGVCLMRLINYEDAIECFNEVIKKKEEHFYGLYYKGYCLQEIGNYKEAITFFDAAIRIYSEDPYVYNNKGYCYYLLSEYEKSIEFYYKAVNLEKENMFYMNIGISYSAMNNHNAALEAYNNAINLDDTDAGDFYERAKTHYLLEKYEKTIDDINKALELGYQKNEEIEKLRKRAETFINKAIAEKEKNTKKIIETMITNEKNEISRRFERQFNDINISDISEINFLLLNNQLSLNDTTDLIELYKNNSNRFSQIDANGVSLFTCCALINIAALSELMLHIAEFEFNNKFENETIGSKVGKSIIKTGIDILGSLIENAGTANVSYNTYKIGSFIRNQKNFDAKDKVLIRTFKENFRELITPFFNTLYSHINNVKSFYRFKKSEEEKMNSILTEEINKLDSRVSELKEGVKTIEEKFVKKISDELGDLILPKDEFETTILYEQRIKKFEIEKKMLLEKYSLPMSKEINEFNSDIKTKIENLEIESDKKKLQIKENYIKTLREEVKKLIPSLSYLYNIIGFAGVIKLNLRKYDADKEEFEIEILNNSCRNIIKLNIPIANAKIFKENWHSSVIDSNTFIDFDRVTLKNIPIFSKVKLRTFDKKIYQLGTIESNISIYEFQQELKKL